MDNGLGDRVSQTVNGTTANFILDLNSGLTQVLQESAPQGYGAYTYLYGTDRIAQYGATSTEYFLGDALGSVRQMVDASGAVVLAKSYDPYGNEKASTGTGASRYGYTGEQSDSYIKLIYLRSRMYSPYLNRMISPDTIIPDPGNVLDWDRYAYSRNNPVKYSDPTGHMVASDDDKEAGCNTPGSPQCIIDKYYDENARDFELEYYFRAYKDYDPNRDPYLEGIDKFIVSSVKTRTGCAGGSTPDCRAFVTVAALLASSELATTDYYPTTSGNTSFQRDVFGDPDCPGCGFVSPSFAPKDILMPRGSPIGTYNKDPRIRTVQDVAQLQNTFNGLIVNATPINVPSYNGQMYSLPGGGTVGWRYGSKSGGPAIDLNIPGVPIDKIHLP